MLAAVSPRLEKSEARSTGSNLNRILVEVCALVVRMSRSWVILHVILLKAVTLFALHKMTMFSHATRKRVIDEVKNVRS